MALNIILGFVKKTNYGHRNYPSIGGWLCAIVFCIEVMLYKLHIL